MTVADGVPKKVETKDGIMPIIYFVLVCAAVLMILLFVLLVIFIRYK